MILGAAIGGAVPNVPAWSEAYASNDVGGILGIMLQPVGGFGKFLLVLLALSVIPNAAGTMYGMGLNWQNLFGLMGIRIPRILYPIAITAIVIPISTEVAVQFLSSLLNFVGIIGFWSSCFITVIVLEHFVFRKGKMENYNGEDWDNWRDLPTGIAAWGASICSLGLVIPGLAKTWYTGPIGRHTGDIGFEMAIAVTALLYVPFRLLEIKLRGR
jgi:purine-cytosine permease-like protein